MKKLTKIFSINARIGSMIELKKEIGNTVVCVPFYNNEVKVNCDGSIEVTEQAFNAHIRFFRTIADC